MKKLFLCSVYLLLVFHSAFAEEKPLIFSTAPTHSMKNTLAIYSPIVNFLSQQTGRKIIFEPATSFIAYSNNLQKDHYDLLFDGPHFVGWRMEKFEHLPLVRLPGEIRIIVAGKKDSAVTDIKQLAGKSVCTFPSPNMLTMAFLENFPNPAQQPVQVLAKGFKGLEACLLNNNKISAAVLRDKMWNKMKSKDSVKILFAPQRSYPERTFAASQRVDGLTRNKIVTALLSDEAKPHLQQLLKTFKRKKLIKANPDDYQGLGKLLNPVWGFELP